MSNTPMQELINWINEIDNSVFAMTAPQNELQMLHNFKNKCKSLLENERSVIIDAVEKGRYEINQTGLRAGQMINGLEYYKKNFTNQ